jgi:general secretion pathway protein M
MSQMNAVAQWWQRVSPREQRLIQVAAAVLGLSLMWWLGLAPALKVLKLAPAQHQKLDAQLQTMQQLQAQTQNLRAQKALTANEAKELLTQSLKPLAEHAQMALQAQRVTISLKQLAPDALSQLLATLRQNARMAPTEAHLQRNAVGTWDGSLVLQLPAN